MHMSANSTMPLAAANHTPNHTPPDLERHMDAWTAAGNQMQSR